MRSRKNIALLLLASLAVTVITAVAALQSRTQSASSGKQEEATPIQEGVMSEKQKKHSKIFKGYDVTAKGKKLRDRVAEEGDVNIYWLVGDKRLPESFNLNNYLQEFARKADAIVVGVVRSKSSQLIEQGSYIFTDYELTVEDVLKNNSTTPLQLNGDITVTRIGGVVKLNGHVVRTIDHSEKLLRSGARYLLFLRFDSEAGTYRSLRDNLTDGSFQLRGNKIIQVSDLPLPFGGSYETAAEPFITEVRVAIKKACGN